MNATYSKLKSGEWGLRVTDGTPEDGDVVTVTKKSGEQRQERVGTVLWRGEDVTLCTIRRGNDEERADRDWLDSGTVPDDSKQGDSL